jgi:hypothetical protein
MIYNITLVRPETTQTLTVDRSGGVLEVVAGTNVTVDNTNPLRPIVSSSGGGGGVTLDTNQTITGYKIFQATTDGVDKVGIKIESISDTDFREVLKIKAGLTTDQRRYFEFVGYNNVRSGLLGFNAQHGFIAYNSILAHHYFSTVSGGETTANSGPGTNSVKINKDEGATGTEGLQIYDGTANPAFGANCMYALSSAGIYAYKGRLIQAQSPDNAQFIKMFSTNGSAYINSSLALRIYNTANILNFANSSIVDKITFDLANGGIKAVGAMAFGFVSKAAPYALTAADRTVEVTAASSTQTLPTAVGISGREYIIKCNFAGTVTVATTSSQTIDGSTTYSLSAQYKFVHVISNGANWLIIGNN